MKVLSSMLIFSLLLRLTENLKSIHLTDLIHHPDLGHYFNCFNLMTCTYEPNKQLRKRYPEDCLNMK